MAQVLITGAERGLGLSLVRRYTDAGNRVFVLCRTVTPELEALAPDIHDGIDVTNASNVRLVAAALARETIDVLINNAGIMVEDDLDDLDVAAIRRQFEVNALGPLNIVAAFRGRLSRGARVINISSRLGSIADNSSGRDYGYRMSKAAQNMLTVNLAHELRDEGVIVAALHPGIVATEMSGGNGDPPDEVAADLKAVIDGLAPAQSGTFMTRRGEIIPW